MLFETTTFLSFALTCVIVELTPGPNMAYLAVLSAVNGRRAGFAAVAGIALGLLIIGAAAGLGLGAAVSSSPVAYEILRISGVCYLFWLAWTGWREPPIDNAVDAVPPETKAKFFRRGLITNILNPKAAVFYIGMLPNFLNPAGDMQQQAILLMMTYVFIATAIHVVIVVLAGSMQTFLYDDNRRRLARRGLSLALAGIAVWFAWSTGNR